MRVTGIVLALVTGLMPTATAHHSIAGMYDKDRRVTIEGVVREYRFVNPHPFVIVEVQNGGASVAWQLELDNRHELVDVGMTAGTFRPGDRLVVTGSPARSQASSMYVWQLDRPVDGFRYEQIGTSPRVSRVRAER